MCVVCMITWAVGVPYCQLRAEGSHRRWQQGKKTCAGSLEVINGEMIWSGTYTHVLCLSWGITLQRTLPEVMLLCDVAMTMTSVPNGHVRRAICKHAHWWDESIWHAWRPGRDVKDHAFYGDTSMLQSLHNRESPQSYPSVNKSRGRPVLESWLTLDPNMHALGIYGNWVVQTSEVPETSE